MAMYIYNNLVIEVSDSDVPYNRRLNNTRARSLNETRNYYTNDDPGEYQLLVDWFNSFDINDNYFLDKEKIDLYIYGLRNFIMPNAERFLNNLENINLDVNFFDNLNERYIPIPRMTLTGENSRYIRFDNANEYIRHFRNLIIGRLTNIIIRKQENNFYVSLEFNSNIRHFLEEENSNGFFVVREEETNYLNDQRLEGAYNKIYYGVPGCGKSYHVMRKYEIEEPQNIVYRTTFHMDYSNTDFVGQILPKLDPNNNVIYEFSPGIFSLSLLAALRNPNNKVILIIEEINRGNAAGIFGDVFQLLDRDATGKSEYKIYIKNLIDWIREKNIDLEEIYLPSNLYIVATMNTSDQNVFTLDTAFKRRWEMEAISNNFDNHPDIHWFDKLVPGSKYSWKEFVNKINNHILSNNIMGLNTEDKRLGIFFIEGDLLTEELVYNSPESPIGKKFAYKALMYIWEDVAKINREDWFEDSINSLDKLISVFLEDNETTTFRDSLRVFKGLFPEKE